MTNPSHPKQRCFMKDFAALDLRSAHAHLRGQSWRPKTTKLTEYLPVSRLLECQLFLLPALQAVTG